MDRTAAASGAYICFRSDLVELRPCCTLRGRLARQLLLLLLLLLFIIIIIIIIIVKRCKSDSHFVLDQGIHTNEDDVIK